MINMTNLFKYDITIDQKGNDQFCFKVHGKINNRFNFEFQISNIRHRIYLFEIVSEFSEKFFMDITKDCITYGFRVLLDEQIKQKITEIINEEIKRGNKELENKIITKEKFKETFLSDLMLSNYEKDEKGQYFKKFPNGEIEYKVVNIINSIINGKKTKVFIIGFNDNIENFSFLRNRNVGLLWTGKTESLNCEIVEPLIRHLIDYSKPVSESDKFNKEDKNQKKIIKFTENCKNVMQKYKDVNIFYYKN